MRQQDAAELLGVGYRTYQSWEEGRATPQGTNLERLARFFGVRPDDILAEYAAPPPELDAKLDQISATLEIILSKLDAAGL